MPSFEKLNRSFFAIMLFPAIILISFSLPEISLAEKNISNKKIEKESDNTPIPLTILPKDGYGMVDWARSVKDGLIIPMDKLADGKSVSKNPLKLPLVYSIKKKKISDVFFSHEVHTYWINCNTCHPAVFKAEFRGTAGMNMTSIDKGKFCGVCHGMVAFRLNECDRCHNQSKK